MNLPNALTVLRIALVPVFGCLFAYGETTAALIVYAVAAVTDALDGFLARRLNKITNFGKLADPLADKLMQMTMLFGLANGGYIALVPVIVVLAVNLYLVVGAALLYGRGVVVHSNWCGKTAMVLLVLSVLAVYPWHTVNWLRDAGRIALYATSCLCVAAAALYTTDAVKKVKSTNTVNEA